MILGIGIVPAIHSQPRTPERVAVLAPGSEDLKHPFWVAFVESLKGSGYAEKRDVVFIARYADGRLEKLPALAAELAAVKPAVIVTWSTAGVAAAKNAAGSIPIVFTAVGDPVRYGFIESFRRPGGNITGVSGAVPGGGAGLDGKVLELIRETLPQAQRIGILMHEGDPTHRQYLARVSPAALA